MIRTPLSVEAQHARAEALILRRTHEMARVDDLARANPERLVVAQRFGVGQTLLAFELHLRPRTCVRDGGAPAIRRVGVRAMFDLGPYPDGPPQVGLVSSHPLFLPGVGNLNTRGAEYFGIPCLYRRFDPERMDLPRLVLALWGVLTADPSQLNAPADAMLVDAAIWLVSHRDELGLPLDPPLREADHAQAPRAPGPRRFRLEEA